MVERENEKVNKRWRNGRRKKRMLLSGQGRVCEGRVMAGRAEKKGGIEGHRSTLSRLEALKFTL